MISFKPEKKNDYKFIIISLTAALVLGAFSLFTDTDSVVYHLVHDIDEDDFQCSGACESCASECSPEYKEVHG